MTFMVNMNVRFSHVVILVDHLLFAKTSKLQLLLNPEEVKSTRFVYFNYLLADIKKNPYLYTPWFSYSVKELLGNRMWFQKYQNNDFSFVEKSSILNLGLLKNK